MPGLSGLVSVSQVAEVMLREIDQFWTICQEHMSPNISGLKKYFDSNLSSPVVS